MLQIRQSTSDTVNNELKEEKVGLVQAAHSRRQAGGAVPGQASEAGNVEWLKAEWEKVSVDSTVAVILVGGSRPSHLRIRQAQSHLRHDFSPSHWSHCLLAWGAGLRQVVEVPLISKALPWPLEKNGIGKAKLSAVDDCVEYPNCALLAIPVGPKEVEKSVAELAQRGRVSSLDVVELTHTWLGFLWGVGRASNPLIDGRGLPSAATIETILERAGFEITPNVVSEASSPEAIWQSARWWNDWHKRDAKMGISGRYRVFQALNH